jgi:hypothetical protein
MNHLTEEQGRRRDDVLVALSASRSLLMAHELQLLRASQLRRRRTTPAAVSARIRLLLTGGTAARRSRSMGSTPS